MSIKASRDAIAIHGSCHDRGRGGMKDLDQALEWSTWISLAQNEACTSWGKALLGRLQFSEHWASDLVAAENMQSQTQEVLPFLDEPVFKDSLLTLRDPQSSLERLRQEGVLEVSELSEIQRLIQVSLAWKAWYPRTSPETSFSQDLKNIPDLTQASCILSKILTPEGGLSEKASPRLQVISSEINHLKKMITQTLDQCLKRLDQQGVLQSRFFDFRDGHFVLPIKIGHHRSVQGLLREVSVSQQTLFIEPQEVEVLNCKWHQKKSELFEETQIILKITSEKLRHFQKSLGVIRNTVGHWDAVCAKARLARVYQGKAIEVLQERSFELSQTAHPLLWFTTEENAIIRNDLVFQAPTQVLVLTGSNTGGKTVILKTLGFAALCARTGFFFPSEHTPKIPFFDQLFLDFGDAQSMTQHISSFSGHLLKFKKILENFQDESLILIDELNSATHPQEGFALSRALLETFLTKKTMMIVTTHDPQLKNLASEDSRILNASVHFDESTQEPTYRLLLGIPGKSRALEIAQKLGIPDQVLVLARKYLDKKHQEFENLLTQLTFQRQKYEEEKEKYLKLQEHFESWKVQWLQENQKIFQDILESTKKQAEVLLEETRRQARLQMQNLESLSTKKQIQTSQMKWGQNLNLSTNYENLQTNLEKKLANHWDIVSPEEPPLVLQKGDWVYVPRWKNAGTVLSIEGNEVKIALGSFQVTACIAEVQRASRSQRR